MRGRQWFRSHRQQMSSLYIGVLFGGLEVQNCHLIVLDAASILFLLYLLFVTCTVCTLS